MSSNGDGSFDGEAGHRSSVPVDSGSDAKTPEAEAADVKEDATLLLDLPWELLPRGAVASFQGAKPTRVRRRLPNTTAREVAVISTPIHVPLVTARPHDGTCP